MYKIGDTVQIRSTKSFVKEFGKNCIKDIDNRSVPHPGLNKYMTVICAGKRAKITNVSNYFNDSIRIKLDVDDGSWTWCEWMFEKSLIDENKNFMLNFEGKI